MKTKKIPTIEERDLALSILERISLSLKIKLTVWVLSTNRSIITGYFDYSEVEKYATLLRENGVKCVIEREGNSRDLRDSIQLCSKEVSRIVININSFLKSKKRAVQTIHASKKFGL